MQDSIIETEKQVLLGTYARPDFVISHGQGMYLYDNTGKRYLDFVAGIAVIALGHCDEQLQQALSEQAARLWHCSNLYHTEPQVRLAKLLVDHSFADKVFFCNSGTEAVEGAIKFARKWAIETLGEDRINFITFHRSFHGRTMAALSATGQEKFWAGFQPLLPGFQFAHLNDLASVEKLVNEKTCAIMVEPVQGEGGIYPATGEFITGLRRLCDQHNCLLIFDEIQCGLGRTGSLFAYESYGVVPDILTLAKPIAGGLPLGAILVNEKVAGHISAGAHGSTFGGGPLVTRIAEVVIERIADPALLQNVRQAGHYLVQRLQELQATQPQITEIRGKGLMVGVDLSIDVKQLIPVCAEHGLLVSRAGDNTLRLVPPLIVERQHIDDAIAIIRTALKIVS